MRTAELAATQRAALASLFAYPHLLTQSGLGADNFGGDHQSIFEAFAEIPDSFRTDSGSVPLLEVARRAGKEVNDLVPITRFEVASPEQGRYYCRQLLQLSTHANIKAELELLAAANAQGKDPADSVLEKLRALHEKYSTSVATAETATLEDACVTYGSHVEAELSRNTQPSALTGIRLIDFSCKGLRPQELTTLFGTGGTGKSTLALDIARRFARKQIHTLYFSGEMSARQMGEKEIHAELGRPQSDRLLNASEVKQAIQRIRQSKYARFIHLDTRYRVTPTQALGACHRQQLEHGLGLVVFDHLRHFAPSKAANEYERLSKAIAEAKQLAKAAAVPVLMITHTNRSREGATRPTLEMIRGSGVIEEESDNVLALWRPEGSRLTELWVLKSRNTGLTGKVTLAFDPRTQTFAELQ